MIPQFFVNRRRFIQLAHDVLQPQRRSGRREWILARGLCHYRCFDLRTVPTSKRDDSLALHVRQWSPFNHYGEYTVWYKGRAQVWIWDHARQQSAQAQMNVTQARILPESVLRPPLGNHGVQIIACCEGYEAQIWEEGCILVSRWWPHMPEDTTWQQFLRTHRLPLTTPVPAPVSGDLLISPWGRARRALSGWNQLRNERLWLTAGAALLLSLTVWQGMAVWRQQDALAAVNAKIESLTLEAGPILQARTQALADQDASRRLLALNPYPPQLVLLAEVATLLPSPEARLKEWLYQNGELRFTVEAPQIDPRQYVETFQAAPMFRDVQTESSRSDKELIIHLRLF
jgi:hypothetical protein